MAFTFQDIANDWHDVQTLTLGELIEGGFDPFGDKRWAHVDWYSDAQRERFEEKFTTHYYIYELGIMPPERWRIMFTSRMLDVMPKYKPVFKAIEEGTASVTNDTGEYYKSRDVNSDFPATQISSGNQDYASDAHDREYEIVRNKGMYDIMTQLKEYDDVDLALIKESGDLFSCLATANTSW